MPYIGAIVRGRTKPAKATWIIWASLDTISLVAMLFANAVNGQILGAVTGAWVVAILSVRFGQSGWTNLDKFCLAGAAVGVVLWALFNDPLYGLAASLSVVFLGSFPTFVNAWKSPESENKLAWILFWVSCVFAVAAVPVWDMANAAQPAVFFAIETIMLAILYIRLPAPKSNPTW